MRNQRFFKITLLFTIALAMLIGCDYIEEAVNEKTSQTKNINEELPEDFPLQQVSGYCTPKTSFDFLMTNSFDEWADIQGYLEEVKVNSVTYSVKDNKNAAEGTVHLYMTQSDEEYLGTDDGPSPPESDRIGSTNTIPAEQNVDDEELNFASGGEDRVEDYMINFEKEFRICIEWTGEAEDVDMELSFAIDVDVTVAPL